MYIEAFTTITAWRFVMECVGYKDPQPSLLLIVGYDIVCFTQII